MIAISVTPANTEEPALLLAALQSRGTAADGAARAVADTALTRLRWACEAAAIDAEDIVTQADEALCLG
ncbi:MAG TPA: hypothetical protein VFL91_02660 [Thermomicrobiales bacterium]|nr:hypothetical protein [Thermomicrobiales bacterium]